ncbi:hypothetical protein C2G38_2235990 [Gigaspora rosea]|uniref:HCP-like protein n=1 Tax=Gigaspora rosea TaxID=44941 RepID=A0A397TRG7_9GLOM|nr:hypothetical protein C2G38_2235990 [Gigaspora rosea]
MDIYSNELCKLGYNYKYGIDIEKHKKKAFKYYIKAAKLGNAVAINDVAICYKNGIGHGIGVEKDEKKAFEYYMKAAKLENVNAIFNAGVFYYNGIGVEINLQEAFK